MGDAAREISKYFPEDNRSEKIYEKSNCIVLDAYNANPKSMTNAIKSVNKFPKKNKVMILGDMNELGSESKVEHENVGILTNKLKVGRCFFVGKNMRYAHMKNSNSLWFEDRGSLEKEIVKYGFSNSDILIKGSRTFELERIMKVVRQIST